MSFITEELIRTLLDLLKRLRELPEYPPGDVKAGFDEIGYSASIIVLAIVVLESTVTRFRYLKKEIARNISASDYFIEMCTVDSLRHQVDEVVAVRDSIVHSHPWVGLAHWNDELQLKYSRQPIKLAGFGNPRHNRVIDREKRTTKVLELNLNPMRIWRRDAFLTIRTLGSALNYLNEIEPSLGVDRTSWFGDGWPKNLREVASSLSIPDYR